MIYSTLWNLIYEILSQEDYIDIVAQLDHATDATNLLDFILEGEVLEGDFHNVDLDMIRQRATPFL